MSSLTSQGSPPIRRGSKQPPQSADLYRSVVGRRTIRKVMWLAWLHTPGSWLGGGDQNDREHHEYGREETDRVGRPKRPLR